MSTILLLTALAAVSILAIIFAAMWLFAMSEMKKKFFYLRMIYGVSETLVATFPYPGAKEFGNRPGMRKIVLRGNRPFHVLIGFDLTAPLLGTGVDVYGFASSRPSSDPNAFEHVAVIATYLGNGATTFRFLCNREASDIVATSFEADQFFDASATYPGHWYQHLGFFS